MTIEVLVRDDNGSLLVRELRTISPDYLPGAIFYKEQALAGISFYLVMRRNIDNRLGPIEEVKGY